MNGSPENCLESAVATAPILVLGLGNVLLRDDGVGPALVKLLADSADRSKGKVEFLDGGTQGLALLGSLAGRQTVIILDALATGAPPGTVHRLTLTDLCELCPPRGNSSHEGNAGELLAAAQLLGELPERLFIIGVEPGTIATGFGLSEHVREALTEASNHVSCVLSQPG